jgi:hypothetical protein
VKARVGEELSIEDCTLASWESTMVKQNQEDLAFSDFASSAYGKQYFKLFGLDAINVGHRFSPVAMMTDQFPSTLGMSGMRCYLPDVSIANSALRVTSGSHWPNPNMNSAFLSSNNKSMK